MTTDRTTYIFIDYENVQAIDLSLIAGKPVKVVLAMGKNQTSVPKALVKHLVEFKEQVELVDNEHPGKNALDFVMVYEIARRALQDPTGYFQIVSRDKGFDALVKYLRTQGTFSARIEDFSKIAALMDPLKLTAKQRTERYLERLQHTTSNRPARKKTLLSQISTFFGKTLDDQACEQIVSQLIKSGEIKVSGSGKVSYLGSLAA